MNLIYIVLFLVSTHLVDGQSLTLTIFNKTGHDIDTLRLCDRQFFKIKAGAKLMVETCKSISMQDGLPFGFPNDIVRGGIKNDKLRKLCGTGVKIVDQGDILADITMSEDQSGYQLFWTHHE
jgi:hypothetical protein